MLEFVKVTALYSNAVLTAILPYVSDFAQRAELRTTPISAGEVRAFACDPRKGQVGGHFYLTNGWHFWFKEGHVDRFETPKSYFSLQDPNRIPEFYAPVSVSPEEALARGRRIISRLKGTAIGEILAREPKITGPIRLSDGTVPRYRIQWPKADAGTNWTGGLGTEVDLEIDAATMAIQMLALVASTNFFQPMPKVDVTPEPIPNRTSSQPGEESGLRLPPVDAAGSNALLRTILPKISEYAERLELPIELPVTPSMIKEGSYTGIYRLGGLPFAQLELTNGYLFLFEHGYVNKFALLYDTFYSIARTNNYEAYVAPIHMTEQEVYSLARETIRKLGYTEKDIPILATRPWGWVGPPSPTRGFTRVYVEWLRPNGADSQPTRVIGMEVDINERRVKSLLIREPRLWRDPPELK